MVHQTMNTSKPSATSASTINTHISRPMSFSLRSSLLVPLAVVALSLAACTSAELKPPAVTPPPAPPPVPSAPVTPQLVPVGFADVPGWNDDDVRAVWPAFMASCTVLIKRPDWKEACTTAQQVAVADGAAVRQFFEAFFIPNQVIEAGGATTGLVTGYYEPLLHGARQRGGKFQTPLYGVPDDLVTIDLAGTYPELKTMRLRGRLVGNKVVPYATRAEIANGGIAGKEILWVDDAVEAFFLEVQGSGRVELDGGRETVRVAYADQNGYPYTSIGRYLVEKNEMTVAQASAQSIKRWIEVNPARRQELFNANRSYVFFREERLPDPSLGPKGALGVPLTPGRSVAIDAHLLPLGAPVFLSTTQANSEVPLQRLVMAQDTGGAIRGAVRADFFFGFGHEAQENAGRMKQRGMLWVLLPKPAATH